MRTHTAMHILCGVIYNTWGAAVTGGNMEPLRARMDFEFGLLPEGFGAEMAGLVNAEIAADRPVEVSFWPRATALGDADLICAKVSLIGDRIGGIGASPVRLRLCQTRCRTPRVASTEPVGRCGATWLGSARPSRRTN